MYIQESVLNLIISKCTIEYSGTHNPDPKHPLWERRACWRVFVPNYGFACKITTPVTSLNSTKKTLDKLFKAELRKRIEAIQETCTTDHSGMVVVFTIDLHSIRSILKCVEGSYV
jgi:hypothetical protein